LIISLLLIAYIPSACSNSLFFAVCESLLTLCEHGVSWLRNRFATLFSISKHVIACFFVFSLVVTTSLINFVSLTGIPLFFTLFTVGENDALIEDFAVNTSTVRLVVVLFSRSKLTTISGIMLLLDILNGWNSDKGLENKVNYSYLG
jgi:hypothetical protein